MTVSESGIDGDYPWEYVIIREQHKKKEHLVAGGSVAEWSKALVLGTSHSMAWVRIPPLPVVVYLRPSLVKRVMLFHWSYCVRFGKLFNGSCYRFSNSGLACWSAIATVYQKFFCQIVIWKMHIKTKIKEEFEFLCHNCTVKTTCRKENDPGRIRTCSLLIRSQTPYPLGHEAITLQQPN